MVTVLLHTTAVKGNRWESNIPKPFSNSERRYSGILELVTPAMAAVSSFPNRTR